MFDDAGALVIQRHGHGFRPGRAQVRKALGLIRRDAPVDQAAQRLERTGRAAERAAIVRGVAARGVVERGRGPKGLVHGLGLLHDGGRPPSASAQPGRRVVEELRLHHEPHAVREHPLGADQQQQRKDCFYSGCHFFLRAAARLPGPMGTRAIQRARAVAPLPRCIGARSLTESHQITVTAFRTVAPKKQWHSHCRPRQRAGSCTAALGAVSDPGL
ncbi:hypothetical protein ACAN107058_21015 [Paracidovorax anthurii]